MPNYDFKCLGCGQETTIFGKASELEEITNSLGCACGNPLMTQLVGTPGIVTRGDGFWHQGYTGD